MYTLIGDIGNTVTKICIVKINSYEVKKIIYLESKNILVIKYLKKKLYKLLLNKKINRIALFSSVVPKYYLTLKKFLKKFNKIDLKEIKENKISKIIKINIKNKKQVGSDRVVNAVGAYKKYKTDCIVLDFGTATTFDVVTKKGVYNGGIIAPGVNLSIKSLSSSADQIPIFSLKKKKKLLVKIL